MFVHGIIGHISVTRYIGRTSAVALFAERLEVYKVKYGTFEISTTLSTKIIVLRSVETFSFIGSLVQCLGCICIPDI